MIITIEVNSCKECPYCYIEQDMGASLPMCKKMKGYVVLNNIDVIHKKCPIKEKGSEND